MADQKPRDYTGLHNVVAYHEDFYSGSAPDGGPGYDTLAAMGIKTVISVDGAAPDIEAAKARGLRYIHLPIGYNGFDESRRLELARATRDALAQGPVYIHCHHGKHRSAGAAGSIVANLGWATPDEMVARMKVSGTAPEYKGLYACTSQSVVLGASVLDAVPANFPEVAPPLGFVKGMVEIDEITEHLKAIEKAGWTTPKDHPDLVPVAEAGRLADHFRIQGTSDRIAKEPADFATLMNENGARAQTLEDLLAAGEKDTAKLSAQFKLVVGSCKDCHARYRD
jgi:protein tyrosine phosphatase (PTP) superfamily phosphohydrolase (DUF442 family)